MARCPGSRWAEAGTQALEPQLDVPLTELPPPPPLLPLQVQLAVVALGEPATAQQLEQLQTLLERFVQ